MKKTIAIIENKKLGTTIKHVRLSNGVVAVNVQSEYEENSPEYFEPKPTVIDNFKLMLKNMQ